MKNSIYFFIAIIVLFQCSNDTGNNPVFKNDSPVVGTWSFSLPYNQDTTFYIIMRFDSSFVYGINVNINQIDTMHRETGTWQVKTDSASNTDTVWMNREHCRQINLATHTLDSIDCGIDTAGIKVNISQDASNRTQWVIPLSDFVNYMPPGIIPQGFPLPPGTFYKQ